MQTDLAQFSWVLIPGFEVGWLAQAGLPPVRISRPVSMEFSVLGKSMTEFSVPGKAPKLIESAGHIA